MSLNPINATLFRERLVSLRKAKGLNQDELSERIGHAENYIMRVETGRIKTVPKETLAKIAQNLDVFIDDLLFSQGYDESPEELRAKILRLTDTDDVKKLRKYYRFLLLATSVKRRILLVVHVVRGVHFRIISARPAKPSERRRYEQTRSGGR